MKYAILTNLPTRYLPPYHSLPYSTIPTVLPPRPPSPPSLVLPPSSLFLSPIPDPTHSSPPCSSQPSLLFALTEKRKREELHGLHVTCHMLYVLRACLVLGTAPAAVCFCTSYLFL